MRILFIYRLNVDFQQSKGIVEKENAIAKAFRYHGYEVDILCNNDLGIILNGELIQKMYFYQTPDLVFNQIMNQLNNKKYELIYLRFSPLSFYQYKALSEVRANFPNLKIWVAMPNYPFLYEFNFFKRMLLKTLISNKWNHMHLWVNRILHLGPEKEIFGIKTIPFDNGIEIKSVTFLKKPLKNDLQINLIYVGTFWPWQGFDLLLKGIAKYSQEQMPYKINLILVGDGPELSNLKSKASEFGIQDMLKFIPPKYGEELDNIFAEAHIGIGTLHHESRQLSYAANLKHRNYAARGIPFIYNVPDHSFHGIKGAYLFDQAEFNLRQIKEWYQTDILPNIENVSGGLQEYANTVLSWNAIVKKVLIAENLPHGN